MLFRCHDLIPSICEAQSNRDTQIEDDPRFERLEGGSNGHGRTLPGPLPALKHGCSDRTRANAFIQSTRGMPAKGAR
jgi:hypothetical protein